MFALYSVMRFFHMLRAGVTWKGPEAIELWYQRVSQNDPSLKCSPNEILDYEEDDSLLVEYDSAESSSDLESQQSDTDYNFFYNKHGPVDVWLIIIILILLLKLSTFLYKNIINN